MSSLFVIAGEPGVGKSRVADYIQRRTDGTILRTDEIRKDLFGPEPEYTSEESQATYDEMFTRARKLLKKDETVILDATFMLKQGRERANRLAQEYTDPYDFTIVRVVADDAVAKKRIRERNGISDADTNVYQSIRDRFEPIELPHVTIDNSNSWFLHTSRQLQDNDEIPGYFYE